MANFLATASPVVWSGRQSPAGVGPLPAKLHKTRSLLIGAPLVAGRRTLLVGRRRRREDTKIRPVVPRRQLVAEVKTLPAVATQPCREEETIRQAAYCRPLAAARTTLRMGPRQRFLVACSIQLAEITVLPPDPLQALLKKAALSGATIRQRASALVTLLQTSLSRVLQAASPFIPPPTSLLVPHSLPVPAPGRR